MPTRLATTPAHPYYEELEQLSVSLGGYADFRLYGAGRLIEAPPDGRYIPYPLRKSPRWSGRNEASGVSAVQPWSRPPTDARVARNGARAGGP